MRFNGFHSHNLSFQTFDHVTAPWVDKMSATPDHYFLTFVQNSKTTWWYFKVSFWKRHPNDNVFWYLYKSWESAKQTINKKNKDLGTKVMAIPSIWLLLLPIILASRARFFFLFASFFTELCVPEKNPTLRTLVFIIRWLSKEELKRD